MIKIFCIIILEIFHAISMTTGRSSVGNCFIESETLKCQGKLPKVKYKDNVTALELSFLPIEILDFHFILEEYPNLRNISVRNSSIRSLIPSEDNNNVKVLRMNNLQLSKISHNFLEHFPNIEILSLEGNNLREMSEHFFLGNIKELYLGSNKWNCSKDLGWVLHLNTTAAKDLSTLTCHGLPYSGKEILPISRYQKECDDLCFLVINKDTIKVGRSPNCDVVMEENKMNRNYLASVSKVHFTLTLDSETNVLYLTDLSKNGTFISGTRAVKHTKIRLKDKAQIAIGHKDYNVYTLQVIENLPDTLSPVGTCISPSIQCKILPIWGRLISCMLHLESCVYLYKCMASEDMSYLPPNLKQTYLPCKILGSGAVGEVRLAFEKYTCKMVAIKKILKGRSTTSQMYKLNHPNKIQTEISILQTLKHPFIIKMEDIVETPEEVYIVLEYMKGGVLSNRITSNVPLSESNIKFLFYQMVLAVQYLHGKGITHRDLKPDNVLLHSDEVETLLKVSDFGLSKVTEGNDMMMTVCGTMCYIAPEMLDNKIKEYNKQVDVWSLGDTPMQYKVQCLLESNLETDEIVMTYDLEPPLKRFRFASDETSN
ncbi:unnamed protein product [Phaedon cochleariae]|uniref:Uncharacterized protein n=1 Tax=Phaedon cochleariae TaxID=80249 RepID=A0A9N9X1S0_PHACE|nr:unnamed protein product [Phaedon cochleariae]